MKRGHAGFDCFDKEIMLKFEGKGPGASLREKKRDSD